MIKRFMIALAVMFAPLAMAACQLPGTDVTLTSPLVDGASVQQNAYAALSAYAETMEEVAEIVEDKATPDTVRNVLATMALNTEKPAQLVREAFQKYDAAVGRVKAAREGGMDVGEYVAEAGTLYKDAMDLWSKHGGLLSSFPGWVASVKAGG